MITAILVFAAPAAIVTLPAPMGTIAACCCIIGIYLREIQRENTAKKAQRDREAPESSRHEAASAQQPSVPPPGGIPPNPASPSLPPNLPPDLPPAPPPPPSA